MSTNNYISPMLTVREVALLLSIHVNTVRRWSDQGKIKATRISQRGDRRFKLEEIKRFLAEMNSHGKNEFK
jgi:excisionase family DNA binding protein